MSIQNRPYAGTWVANRRNVVQWTPDFQVYVNGDTSLPGCQTCHHNIDLNEFINSISVDFGVEPGASNCSIGMSIPRHYGDSIFRDGNTLLRPGLEVHVYFRGYFPMKGLTTPNSRPVAGINLGDIPQHPYYPVFHGVVTNVTHDYSGGFYTANMTCNGMLHFWEHMKLSGAGGGSFFGTRPANSGIQTTLTGHPMTGKTPYAIIYSLYRDTAGVADGVGFALSSRTNLNAVNSTTRDPLYALTLRYWEQRFRGKIYGLRMHGASGQLFTSSQQAFLSLYGNSSTSFGGSRGTGNVSPSTGHESQDIFAQDPAVLLGLRARTAGGRISRQADTVLLAAENEGRNSHGLDVSQLQAFPTDVGSYGQVNLWESTYESKMDIATAVTNVCGYEFYQDADGDLVFKPPMYNLDTSSSRVYRIEPEDIVSINFVATEPAATYCLVKGGAFQNTRGLVDESEWGCRSQYVDYKLVAQYGWIETSVESTYYTNPRSAFYFAINHLDRINAGTSGATVTIPLRPEIRPGYPVYIPHIDCFYYVTQISHSLNLGSECTTTLTLTARRRKFLAPGSTSNTNVALDQNLSAINLANTESPARALQALDNSGNPRLVGFPNVVMAIDPTAINPMFQALGFQAVENELTRENGRQGSSAQSTSRQRTFAVQLVQALLSRTPATLRPIPPNGSSGTLQPPSSGDPLSTNADQRYTVVGLPGTGHAGVSVSLREITVALTKYINARNSVRDANAILFRRKVQIQNEMNAEIAAAQRATPPREVDNRARQTELTRINTQIQQLNANWDASPPDANNEQLVNRYNTLVRVVNSVEGGGAPRPRARLEEATTGGTNSDANNVILMSYLLGQFRVGGSNTGDTRTDPSGTINESANLLQMLSDRKASLSLTVPGYYRYYSASHPNPEMQGYLPVDTTESAEETVSSRGGTVTAEGRVTGATREVTAQSTPMSGEQAAGYLQRAWRQQHNGQNPPNGALEVLLAQWALETGRGRRMLNYNFGGIKAVGAGFRTRYGTTEGDRVAGTATRQQLWFQAYGNADEGARHFVRILTQGMHRGAFAAYMQEIANGNGSTAGRTYAERLKASGYYTGNMEDYARNVQGLLPTAAGWARNARTDQGPTDPASSPRTSGSAATIPPSTYSTVVVRAATDANIPENRRGNYVEVVPNHIPTKGLKVRVMSQRAPLVVPTNVIYSMTFESRGQARTTPVSVPTFNANQPRQTIAFINSCLNPRDNDTFVRALTQAFVSRVGTGITTVRTTAEQVRALIALSVEGITDLRTSEGLIRGTPFAAAPTSSGPATNAEIGALMDRAIAENATPPRTSGGVPIPGGVPIYNITDGVPNNFDPSGTASIRSAEAATAVLAAKARALVVDVTQANFTNLNRAREVLRGVRGRTPFPAEAQEYLNPWLNSLRALFRGDPPPQRGIFVPRSEVRVMESSDYEDFSPVFPVSDAKGFEHYGSFQYGRGLSIEPGGNYERLMASDPLQFLTDAQRERLLNAIVRGDREGGNAALNEAARALASSGEPGAEVALDYLENDQRNGDRTTMIANGLRNYIMSDRDAVTKVPVNNAAYRLADLTPMGQQDTCACRGAEADLLLAAYMAGTSGFTQIVSTEEEASAWVSSQMVQASVAWANTQDKMRGMSMEQGRRSLLDSVEGWNTITSGFRQTNATAAAQIPTTGPVPPRGQ
jgi:flagellum-specific peptidoglycan hydrolase FlgJ